MAGSGLLGLFAMMDGRMSDARRHFAAALRKKPWLKLPALP